MGQHARLITNLKLVKELGQSAGRADILEEDVVKLAALVIEVADAAGPLLERIPVTFKQYTEHNILHCRNLIDLMGRFIPCGTLEQLNALELAVLIISALLHDFGMFVSEKEKREALKSAEFDAFLAGHHDRATALEDARRAGDDARAELIQDALLAEYFRRLHPERVRAGVTEKLKVKLSFGDVDISKEVFDVCESHAWGVYESHDSRHLNKAVSKLPRNRPVYGVPLNLQYLACCLRLADIMDFDRSRTPLVVFQNMDFTEEKSWEEWNKHLSVKGWEINEREVLFRAECSKPAYYVAVMDFLEWVDHELVQCRRLVSKEAPADIAARYQLQLPPVVDRTQIEMEDKSYLAGAFRFQLEYDRIMKLLMDKSLYPDPSLFLRELLQNSLDACRSREAHAKDNQAAGLYTPRIVVRDYSEDAQHPRILFQDNGVGMSRRIVENYFMRVGRSYYRSPEFDAERARLREKGISLEATSQFGIGILSCFMVADRFEVETYRVNHQPLHIAIEGPTKYFIIRLLDEPPRADFQPPPASDFEDGPPNRPGTRITVHLRPGLKLDVAQTLETFAANVDYDIAVYRPGEAAPRPIPRLRWESAEQQAQALDATIAEQKRKYFGADDEDVPDPGSVSRSAVVAESLRDVLLMSPVPFEADDPARRLRGGAWLWLLNDGRGGVCTQRGYLKISPGEVSCTGLPAFLGEYTGYVAVAQDTREWRSFLAALGRFLSPADPGRQALEEQLYSAAYGIYSRHSDDKIDKDRAERMARGMASDWFNLSRPEREAALKYFEQWQSKRAPWYEVAGVAGELARGELGCIRSAISFGERLPLNASPQDVALHGILLPAGFVKWDPMAGFARKRRLLAAAGGVQLDVRGTNTPTPAASRLFVEVSEAAKVGVPLAHAILRHALAISRPGGEEWERWFDEFLITIRKLVFWPEAVFRDYEALEERLGYTVSESYNSKRMSRQQIIDKFGRWAPTSHKGTGLTNYNERNKLLLAFRPRRKREGAAWEVDMQSVEPLREESFEKAMRAYDKDVRGW